MIVTRKLILTGPHAGKTISLGKRKSQPNWGGYRFVDGECVLRDQEENVDRITNYLARSYQAFPEGSDALAAAQKAAGVMPPQEGDADGQRDAVPARAEGNPAGFPGEPRPDGQGHPAQEPAHVGGDDEGDAGQPAARGQAEGDGENPESAKIKAALTVLDPDNDEHWTALGAPRVDAVAELTGNAAVTRADLDREMPGLDREVAKQAKAEAEAAPAE